MTTVPTIVDGFPAAAIAIPLVAIAGSARIGVVVVPCVVDVIRSDN
jgi:hypothetical protein